MVVVAALLASTAGGPGGQATPKVRATPAAFTGDPAAVAAFGATPSGKGLWVVAADGTVTATGDAAGTPGPEGPPPSPTVGVATDPAGAGYWLAGADGTVVAGGGAPALGSASPRNAPIVGIAPTPTGHGYWLAAADGGIFALGDAHYAGSAAALRLDAPIVGIAPTPTGHGYWLAAADGGIFALGDAHYAGSAAALRLDAPIVGIAPTPTGRGYWLAAADGGIFAFGDAAFLGSAAALPAYGPATAIAATADGHGYWILAADGSVEPFGDATPALGAGPRPRTSYGVASRLLDVTDPMRPTPPRGAVPGHPGRDLPTLVLSPAGLDGAALPGPWPLVVFAHGFATTPVDYLPLLQAWAADGYAVAAPYLPGERPDIPGSPDEADRAQEPADLTAVISAVLSAGADPSSPLAGLVDPARVAVAGHSDGAMAVAALTLDSAYHDPRIKAALILSGAELGVPGGAYGVTPSVPVLIAQGTADPVNNPSAANGLFAVARGPKALLWILGAGHLPPYVTAGVQQDILRAATADFLDVALRPSRAGLERLAHDGDTPGMTALVAAL